MQYETIEDDGRRYFLQRWENPRVTRPLPRIDSKAEVAHLTEPAQKLTTAGTDLQVVRTRYACGCPKNASLKIINL